MEEVEVLAVRTRKLRLSVPIITANRWPFTALFARSRYALFVFEIAMQLIRTTCSHWQRLAKLKRWVFLIFLFLFNFIYRGQQRSMKGRSFFFFFTDYSVIIWFDRRRDLSVTLTKLVLPSFTSSLENRCDYFWCIFLYLTRDQQPRFRVRKRWRKSFKSTIDFVFTTRMFLRISCAFPENVIVSVIS